MDKVTRAFKQPEPPIEELIIDRRTLNHIRDVANQIWQETRIPNANLIMFEALHQLMVQKGLKPQFRVEMGHE